MMEKQTEQMTVALRAFVLIQFVFLLYLSQFALASVGYLFSVIALIYIGKETSMLDTLFWPVGFLVHIYNYLK